MEEGTSDTNCVEATLIDPQSIAMFNVPTSEAALPPPPHLLGVSSAGQTPPHVLLPSATPPSPLHTFIDPLTFTSPLLPSMNLEAIREDEGTEQHTSHTTVSLIVEELRKQIIQRLLLIQSLTATHIQPLDLSTYGQPESHYKTVQKTEISHELTLQHDKEEKSTSEFKCDLCMKQLSSKWSLTCHKRRHRGHKPHECHLCDYKTVEKSHLDIHIRTHTGEKPYHCPLCIKQFKTGTTLSRHLRLHTGGAHFVCIYCGSVCPNSTILKIHKKKCRLEMFKKPAQMNTFVPESRFNIGEVYDEDDEGFKPLFIIAEETTDMDDQ